MTTIYKIRSADGLFSTGGMSPHFNKKGKVWSQRNHVSAHFSQCGHRADQLYRENQAQVVEFELVEVELSTTPADQWIAAADDRAAVKEARRIERARAWQEKVDLKRLEELRKKYPIAFAKGVI